MPFSDLGLMPELLRALSERGYSQPTPVQEQAIPAVLSGRDLLAAAQTGTVKPAPFVLPSCQRLQPSTGTARRALVRAPARELAAQIADSARLYGKHTG